MLTVLVTREPKQKSPGRGRKGERKEESKRGRKEGRKKVGTVAQLYGTGSSGGGGAGSGSPLPKKHNQGATQHEEQPAERA